MLLLKRLSSTLAQTPKSTIAQIYAFKSRSGMDLEQSTLSQALTLSPNQETGENERLAMLGESCLSLFTTEYLFQKYPSMPAPVLKSLCKAYVGSGALRSVGLGFGVQNVMEIKKELDDKQKEMVVGLVLKSLIGAFYKEKVCVQLIQGAIATRTFIHKHFLSRNVEAGDHLHYIIKRPRALLIKVAEKLNKKRPIARILKELAGPPIMQCMWWDCSLEVKRLVKGTEIRWRWLKLEQPNEPWKITFYKKSRIFHCRRTICWMNQRLRFLTKRKWLL